MVDFLITPASGTAAISDSSGVSTTPGANKLWASGTNLYWGTTQVDGGGGGASSINDLSDALVENNSIWLGDDPSSVTNSAEENAAVGIDALDAITTGDGNVAMGYQAATALTTAGNTIAIGKQTLKTATTGGNNTMIGARAGQDLAGASANNVALGYDAMRDLTLASYNIAIGRGSLGVNDDSPAAGTTDQNIAIGAFALSAASGASSDVAIGYNTLASTTTGYKNTALGVSAGKDNTTGWQSVFIGDQAGESQTTATYNVYIGSEAGEFCTGGSNNTVIGRQAWGTGVGTGGSNVVIGAYAGMDWTSVNESVAIGYGAAENNTTEDRSVTIGYLASNTGVALGNVAIGYQAGKAFTSTSYENVVIGYNAAYLATARNLTVMGRAALSTMVTGNNQTAIGHETLAALVSGASNTALGKGAGSQMPSGNNNVHIGEFTGRGNSSSSNIAAYNVYVGDYSGYKNEGDQNVGIGGFAQYENTTGYSNIAVGYTAMEKNTAGHSNTAIGHAASRYNTTGTANVAVGYNALTTNVHGDAHVAVGYEAFKNTATADNDGIGTAVGYKAGRANTTGRYNTYIGGEAGGSNTDTDQNTMIGYAAGYSATATENVMIGSQAGYDNVAGNYNVFVGAKAAANATGVGNSVVIGRQAMGAAAATGDDNTIVGYQAGYDITSGHSNVLLGSYAGTNITDLYENTIIGFRAGQNLASQTTHGRVTLVGYQAGYYMTGTDIESTVMVGWNAGYNYKATKAATLVGGYAGYNLSGTGDASVAIGVQAGYGAGTGFEADNCVFIGNGIAETATSSQYDVFIGGRAGGSLGNNSVGNTVIGFDGGRQLGNTANAQYNTIIGYQAAYYLGKTDGGITGVASTGNIAIGKGAGIQNRGGNKNVYIGFEAGPSSATAEANKLYINNAAGTPLIDGDFSANTLNINGTLDSSGLFTAANGINVAGGDLTTTSLAMGVTVTEIKDEDNMASDSATMLATQQSIKAYVDSQSGGGGLITSSTRASTGAIALYGANNATLTSDADFVFASNKLQLADDIPICWYDTTNLFISGNYNSGNPELHLAAGNSGSFIVRANTFDFGYQGASTADTVMNFYYGGGGTPDNDGQFKWDGSADAFVFMDEITMNSDERINFGDTGTYMYQSADGRIDIVADTAIGINATTTYVNGDLDLSGDFTGNLGTSTFDGTLTATSATKLAFRNSNSYIQSNASNNLQLTDDTSVNFQAPLFEFNANTASSNTQLVLKSTDAGSTSGPKLNIDRDSALPANNDTLGIIQFRADVNATGMQNLNYIASKVLDVTATSENSVFHFSSLVNNSSKVLQWGSHGTTGDYGLYPTNDGTADLGVGSNQWRQIHGTDYYSNGVPGVDPVSAGGSNLITWTVGSYVYAFEGVKGIITSFQEVNVSDENLKQNISVFDTGLSLINQLEPKKFTFTEDFRNAKKLPSEEQIGYIAQDVEKISEDYVSKTVDYEGKKYLGMERKFDKELQAALVNAIKELSAKNDALEARIAALEG